MELGDKCCDSSFHSCTASIKAGICRGKTGICERFLLCSPYDKKELSVACIFPGNSDGTSVHLSCASHISSVQMFWQKHKLPFVVYPAASSFGCRGFLPCRTRMVQSPMGNIYHCLFTQQLVPCTKWAYTYWPKCSVGFWPPSKRAPFQLKFSKTSGYKDQQHPHQLQPTCIWQNADFRSNSAGLGGAGNSTQNLSCSE